MGWQWDEFIVMAGLMFVTTAGLAAALGYVACGVGKDATGGTA